MAIIYKITNKIDGKSYIGFTKTTVEQRFMGHVRDSKRTNYPFHNAIQKYGKDSFDLEVLEESDDGEYLHKVREKYWIEQFNKTYNIQRGGEGGTRKAPVFLHRQNMVEEFGGPTEAALFLGKDVTMINHALERHREQKASGVYDANGLYWVVTRSRDDTGIKHPRFKNMKPIVDTNGNIYESAFEAAREFDVSPQRIRRAVKGGGRVKGCELMYVESNQIGT